MRGIMRCAHNTTRGKNLRTVRESQPLVELSSLIDAFVLDLLSF